MFYLRFWLLLNSCGQRTLPPGVIRDSIQLLLEHWLPLQYNLDTMPEHHNEPGRNAVII